MENTGSHKTLYTRGLDFEQQRNQKNEDNGRGWHTEDLGLKEAGHSSAPIFVGSPRCGLTPPLPMAPLALSAHQQFWALFPSLLLTLLACHLYTVS